MVRMAWRNIWRNRSRSLVILISVAIGLWAGIFLMAFYNGMIRQRIRSAIEGETSHLQIHHPLFAEDGDVAYHLGSGDSLIQFLKRHRAVRISCARVVSYGMASTAAGSTGVKISGVQPSEEAAVTGLSRKIIEGTYFSQTGRHEILLGKRLATKLRLAIGQKVVLTINDADGELSSSAFRVVGLYSISNSPYEESNVFVRISEAGQLAAMDDAVNEVAVLLHQDRDVDGVASALRARFASVEVKTWTQLSPEMQLLVVTMDRMMFIFMGIIMLALSFGIINTMLMSVLERTREIGMLLSLGMIRPLVFGMVILETLFMVLAGCPAGILAAILTVAYTQKNGIDLSGSSEVMSSFGWESRAYPSLEAGQVGVILLLVICTALLSALFPARRTLKLKPAEAIRK